MEGNLAEVQRLVLKEKVHVDVKDLLGFTPLINASMNGHVEIVNFLLENNANPNYICLKAGLVSFSALAFAVFGNYFDIACSLLQYGADPNVCDKMGDSLLYYAAFKNNIKIVHLLLENGADPSVPSKYNRTALSFALENSRLKNDRLNVAQCLIDSRPVCTIDTKEVPQLFSKFSFVCNRVGHHCEYD